MSLTRCKRAYFLAVILASIVVISVAFAKYQSIHNQHASASPSATTQQEGPVPTRLIIPAIHVDAAIEVVGLTKTGAVDVPKDPANAAWLNKSVRPGEVGSSVIDGHYGWKNGGKAVFDNLSALHVGEQINVQDSTGTTTSFIVREMRSVAANETVPDIFISKDGTAHLNLITCEGTWDKTAHSYSKRLIIFADKKSSKGQ